MSNIFDLFKKIEDKEKSPAKTEFAIIGLGNPGDKYAGTRHNMGFMCIDYISQKLNVKVNKSKYKALYCQTEICGKRVLLVKPQTYMNNSGESIREVCDYLNLTSKNIIILYDDMSLDTGRMRIREKGSAGGHNGIKSIISQLGTEEFLRIKIGVGIPKEGEDIINFVLGNIPKSEREKVYSCIEKTYEAIKLIISGEVSMAMNLYN